MEPPFCGLLGALLSAIRLSQLVGVSEACWLRHPCTPFQSPPPSLSHVHTPAPSPATEETAMTLNLVAFPLWIAVIFTPSGGYYVAKIYLPLGGESSRDSRVEL